MSWRDDVILAAAKRIHFRDHKATLQWEEDRNQEYWLKLTADLIQDIANGAVDAGWRMTFIGAKDGPYFADENGET
jgi:hypothetical protein